MKSNVFKEKGNKAMLLQEKLGISRTTAWRIVSGERFKKIKALFARIFEITGLTPNDILNIPPKTEAINDNRGA